MQRRVAARKIVAGMAQETVFAVIALHAVSHTAPKTHVKQAVNVRVFILAEAENQPVKAE